VCTGDQSQRGSSTALEEPPGPHYFLIKSDNFEDIKMSVRRGAWTFPHYVADKLKRAYKV